MQNTNSLYSQEKSLVISSKRLHMNETNKSINEVNYQRMSYTQFGLYIRQILADFIYS